MNRNSNSTSFALAIAVLFGGQASKASAADLPPPDQKGPYNVGTHLFTATVTGGRVARIQVFYPTLAPSDPTSHYTINAAAGNYNIRSPLGAVLNAPPAPGPFPLVVHDHGGGAAGLDFHRVSQLPVQETLASHGFVATIHLHAATPLARARDIPVVIDVMLARNATVGDGLYNTIDPTRIGVSGISAGGAAALSAVGGWAANGIVGDSRIKAMVVYEPAVNSLPDAGNVTIPYLAMGGLQHRAGLGIPALFDATTLATPRIYVQTARAAHFSYNTGMQDELDQTREQALLALGADIEPLTTQLPANAAAARAFEIWNWGQILFPLLGPGVGGGRHTCDRVGLNSIRPLDLDGDGFTDSPPFIPIEPPYMTQTTIRPEVMVPMIKLYTIAFWKTRLEGDHRYQRYLAPGYAQSHNLEAKVFVGD